MIKSQSKLDESEELVSYDVESLFTNVPVRPTINYIMDQIFENIKSIETSYLPTFESLVDVDEHFEDLFPHTLFWGL